MARGLVWSPEAIEDIEAIASYIERDSPWYAKAVASKIVETAETILHLPNKGGLCRKSMMNRFASDSFTATGSSIASSLSGFSSRRWSTARRLLRPFVNRIEGVHEPSP